jgi:hypothetical protein
MIPTPGTVARSLLSRLLRCHRARQSRLDLPDLGLRIVQLRHDEPQDRPRQFRQANFVLFDRCDQAFDMAQTLRRDDAEFGQMRAQRIDRHGPLTNE